MQEENQMEHNHVIIFDYDDTIFPNTYINNLGLSLSSDLSSLPQSFFDDMEHLAEILTETIEQASKLGDLYLVTNGKEGWIELSCSKFIPSLSSVLKKFKRVISARSTYEFLHPENPIMWKKEVFSDILREFILYTFFKIKEGIFLIDNETMKLAQLISIGDGIPEREASILATKEYNQFNILCKTVKFVERPSCEQLKLQIIMVRECLERIRNHHSSIDVEITLTECSNIPKEEYIHFPGKQEKFAKENTGSNEHDILIPS